MLVRSFPQLLVAAAAHSVAVAGVCLLGLTVTSSAQATPSLASASLTQAQLSTILVQGVATVAVPSHLKPSLAKAKNDTSLAWRDGCLVGHGPTTMPKPCVFGDTKSHTDVVLFGDSHAGAWFAGINVVSKQQHWRLVFMGKIGCPTIADVLVKRNDGVWYHSCVTWRHNMEQKIIKLHPRLLVLTSSDYVGRAEPDAGRFTSDHEQTWLKGVHTAFEALRHAARRVVFIANTPEFPQPAYSCVSRHRTNVYPCTVSIQQAFQDSAARQGEFQIAKADGIAGIDPTSWFCTPTRCPIIADNILIFRDSQHITPEWAQFLAPMLSGALVPLVTPTPSG